MSTGAERKDSYTGFTYKGIDLFYPCILTRNCHSLLINPLSARVVPRIDQASLYPPLSLVISDSFSLSLLLIILRVFSLSLSLLNRRGKNSASNKRVTLKILFFLFFPPLPFHRKKSTLAKSVPFSLFCPEATLFSSGIMA